MLVHIWYNLWAKKRLSRYGDNKKGYFDIKVSDEQMKMICNNLSQIAYNTIKKEITIDRKEKVWYSKHVKRQWIDMLGLPIPQYWKAQASELFKKV